MAGFFDKLFDFNHDGKLNMFERATQVAAFTSIMDDAKEKDDPIGLASFGESCDDDDLLELDDIQKSELEDAGLDEIDLEFMDEDERREAIEDAGLDPDDYDFD